MIFKQNKKLSITIASVMIISLICTSLFSTPVYAKTQNNTDVPATSTATSDFVLKGLSNADILNRLGFFKGTDKGYELNKSLTRAEAITLFVRLLGKEDEAMEGKYAHPFNDVPKWAANYVALAYDYNLTSGVSATKFGSQDKVTGTQFATFLLRALDYRDDKGDFNWSAALNKMSSLGIITSSQASAMKSKFVRGDAVDMSLNTLNFEMKDCVVTLLDTLVIDKVVTEELANVLQMNLTDESNYEAYIVHRAELDIVDSQEISDKAVDTAEAAVTKAEAAKTLANKYINNADAKAKAQAAVKDATNAIAKADTAVGHAAANTAIVAQEYSSIARSEISTNIIVQVAESAMETARDARRSANEAMTLATNATTKANAAKTLATTLQAKILTVPWNIISSIGRQPRGMCSAYCIAYARAIMYNTYFNPYSYWNGSGAVWSSGGGTDRRYGSASVIPGYVYDEIKKGKPCIIYCTYSGGSHYLVAYGWKKGTTRSNATYNSFYYIDPVTASGCTFSGYYAPSGKYQIITF